MRKSGVFDLDGTLASTASAHFTAWLAALRDLGLDGVTFDERLLLGRRASEIAQIILASLGKPGSSVSPDELTRVKNSHFSSIVKERAKPMPCALEVVSAVRRSGGKVVVVTSASRFAASLVLDVIGVRPDVLITSDDVERGKPDPEPVVRALSVAGLRPTEAFGVGDTINDVEAFWRAGIRDIYLVRGDVPMSYSDEEVSRFGARRARDLCEVLSVEFPDFKGQANG